MMRAPKLISLISTAVLAALYPNLCAGQCSAAEAGVAVEESVFRLHGEHQAISCLERQEAAPPVVIAPDNVQTALSYQDHYFKLGCAVSGFEEYFAPSRWAAVKINGDGGVDVTGAPNSILVEGANRASVIATPGSAASYRIAIPAEGYVSFDWGYIGGSNFYNQQFWVEVNGKRAESMAEGHTAGSFFSSLLSPGDELAFNIVSDKKGFQIQLSNFEFLSNTISVIERRWEARADNGRQCHFTQLISIKKPDFTKVVFPGNCDGIEYPMIDNGVSIAPEWTGYPAIDEDGSIATTNDQYPLAGDGCAFSVKWEDEALNDEGACIIFRHWFVSDHCGDNIQEHTQVIKVRGGCPEGGNTLPYGQRDVPKNGDKNALSLQQYSASNLALQATPNTAAATVQPLADPLLAAPAD